MGQKIVKTCDMKVEVFEDGDYDAEPVDDEENIEACKQVLDQMNPRMGRVWKRHLTDDGREYLGFETKKDWDELEV